MIFENLLKLFAALHLLDPTSGSIYGGKCFSLKKRDYSLGGAPVVLTRQPSKALSGWHSR
jgi:hypothetical protein